MWMAFEGSNYWYVAWKDEEGFHHQPFYSEQMSEERAKLVALELNEKPG